jgi:hypothetical protein
VRAAEFIDLGVFIGSILWYIGADGCFVGLSGVDHVGLYKMTMNTTKKPVTFPRWVLPKFSAVQLFHKTQ